MSSRFPGGLRRSSRKRKRDSSAEEDPEKKRKDDLALQQKEMAAFFRLLENKHIRLFLSRDGCMKTSDKYLLAMVLVYFRRAGLSTMEYRKNFFPALFLANQFEEEEEGFREEIYPWALGRTWFMKRDRLFRARNLLLLRMDFSAWVDRATCDLIMAQDPLHWAWTRERKIHHSWAVPDFRREESQFTVHGPWSIPPSCSLCKNILHHPSEGYDCQADLQEDSD